MALNRQADDLVSIMRPLVHPEPTHRDEKVAVPLQSEVIRYVLLSLPFG